MRLPFRRRTSASPWEVTMNRGANGPHLSPRVGLAIEAGAACCDARCGSRPCSAGSMVGSTGSSSCHLDSRAQPATRAGCSEAARRHTRRGCNGRGDHCKPDVFYDADSLSTLANGATPGVGGIVARLHCHTPGPGSQGTARHGRKATGPVGIAGGCQSRIRRACVKRFGAVLVDGYASVCRSHASTHALVCLSLGGAC